MPDTARVHTSLVKLWPRSSRLLLLSDTVEIRADRRITTLCFDTRAFTYIYIKEDSSWLLARGKIDIIGASWPWNDVFFADGKYFLYQWNEN